MSLLEKLGLARRQHASLVILDDIFPHLLSAFRIAEFNAYLARYPNSRAYSTALAFPAVGEYRSFEEVRAEYLTIYPDFQGRVFRYGRKIPRADLFYFVFLQNAAYFMNVLEGSTTPFVFTLYPGFQAHEPEVEATLRQVCALPNLAKVITTQKISHEYMLGFLEPEKVELIYGGVFPSDQLAAAGSVRKYYRKDKGTFDMCFVAFKYMPGGLSKGYDSFIEVAKELCRQYDDIFFHVVGPYDRFDIDVTDLRGRIKFYGVRQTSFFPEFYSEMDLVLAPTVPFILRKGAFDGFPTGCCIEAGLCGVAVFCTDPLKMNVAFKDGEEIVIVPAEVQGICDSIEKYYSDSDRLMELGRRGQEAFRRTFGLDAQLKKRFEILDQYLPTA
ncbi:MAG TPA: glycosyltransferase family 4 protein [Pyrinomonadaceae bacterium]|nr:glycosyltransferase family 4 protein [Pyrinomonadaceae bacterium]